MANDKIRPQCFILRNGDAIGKIASLLGIGHDQAGKAVNAAVPSLLAGLIGKIAAKAWQAIIQLVRRGLRCDVVSIYCWVEDRKASRPGGMFVTNETTEKIV